MQVIPGKKIQVHKRTMNWLKLASNVKQSHLCSVMFTLSEKLHIPPYTKKLFHREAEHGIFRDLI